jgi:hypothetical protein
MIIQPADCRLSATTAVANVIKHFTTIIYEYFSMAGLTV